MNIDFDPTILTDLKPKDLSNDPIISNIRAIQGDNSTQSSYIRALAYEQQVPLQDQLKNHMSFMQALLTPTSDSFFDLRDQGKMNVAILNFLQEFAVARLIVDSQISTENDLDTNNSLNYAATRQLVQSARDIDTNQPVSPNAPYFEMFLLPDVAKRIEFTSTLLNGSFNTFDIGSYNMIRALMLCKDRNEMMGLITTTIEQFDRLIIEHRQNWLTALENTDQATDASRELTAQKFNANFPTHGFSRDTILVEIANRLESGRVYKQRSIMQRLMNITSDFLSGID